MNEIMKTFMQVVYTLSKISLTIIKAKEKTIEILNSEKEEIIQRCRLLQKELEGQKNSTQVALRKVEKLETKLDQYEK